MNNKEVSMKKEEDPDFWDHIFKFLFIVAFLTIASLIVGLFMEEETVDEREGQNGIQPIEHISHSGYSAMHAGRNRV